MKKSIVPFTILFLISSNLFSQSLDKFKITNEELPKEYTLTEETQCQAIQACLFYKQTNIYSSFLGKVKSKEIQNFENKNDSGSIMYFEFEKDFEGEGFLKGLLWGKSNEPTKAHPEEIIVKGKFLIVYSFKKESDLKKLSQDKIKQLLN